MADDEWRDCFINFLDETICNVIPTDPDPDMSMQSCQHHACSVCGISTNLNPCSEVALKAQVKDLQNVVLECQCHSHTSTCYNVRYPAPAPTSPSHQ